ncbi:ParB/RepB/Spo0J family partition protein [Stenotrophomonas maltophilia]|jgi:ParB family chromosome partitioning protein|uniref:ParB/RepB/Spo0J family partition protein n=1 Tax=Stenotrophomonas maltophilia TaxID=40324 RepID=UPI0002B8B8DC|nr:ParB/RepB/Spo0J family partition protein [Stenotrophomonas maltophilia]EMF62008.1 putative plasmid stabilization protein [Stenotrophomonas maltophilia EPM1]KWV49197.1 chromosome partitioning protein ParB [Stenotrophomonas maltophilia]MBA0461878.1 ParB/RepB/Spo0J family partition protein [Stenotrophomonas maltophilia]MBC8773262.1 ParB/RepB/Spo0J family partition protein [Stenotrophomonas maltophilia]QJC75163.1 ParB/RepB/Spo0J family partition protein [Stenotrophomonas maltophilia]
MNAVTKTEAIALETAAPLEVADPTKNLILITLSQLLPRRSKRNVRTTPRQSIPELAASIARVGLLQNLIVILSADGEQYEVVAGDRRLTALKLLAKKKRIAADCEVPCLLVADASARTVSLAENVQRENMHPADQFAAFAALVKEGRPIEDIAADFGVSPLVVQRRLKLANVSPRLLADYRAGAATLEQLMALTVTDDHAAQEAAYYGAPEWQRGASALRDRLTEREITATHPLVRFVGLDAYTQAGGGIRRDLFAEGDAGTYLTDAALLETLLRGRLDAQAEDVRAEGWAWVEAVPNMSHAERQMFQNAPRHRREPTSREARRIASLQNRLDKLDAELEEAYDAEDEGKTEALEPRREQVAEELQAIEEGLRDYAPDVRAVAGAIVTLDREGEAVIHRGLLREAEAKALRTLEKLRQGFSADDGANDEEGHDDEAPKAASLSDRLVQRLSAHRTVALQIEVARHPRVALAALVHGMVRTVLQDGYHREGLPLGVSLKVQDRLEGMAPDVSESAAALALRTLQEVAGETLPQDSAELFTALQAKSQDELVRLLAVCVASTVDVVMPRASQQHPGAELAQAVGLDMAAWWKPTAEGYFRHIAKPAILAAVNQYAPAHVTRLSKLKKGDIASEAERLAEGTGWMPVVFQIDHHTEPESAPEAEDEADAPDDAAEVKEAHVLAA